MRMRTCRSCKETKDIEEFSIEKRHSSGRNTRCKSCSRTANKKSYYKHRATYLERYKKYAHENRAKSYERTQLYAKLYPQKYKARNDLRNAVKYGKVKKLPCEVCGETRSQGHHPDYSKALEVIWLCSYHHGQIHRSQEGTLISKEILRRSKEFRGV